MKGVVVILAVVVIGLGVAFYTGAFEEEKGPAESLGEALDQTLRDAERNLREATE